LEHRLEERDDGVRDRSTDFLMGAATGLGAACLSGAASSAAEAGPSTTLTLGRGIIDVSGRSASVFGMREPNGAPGLYLDPGQPFRVGLSDADRPEVMDVLEFIKSRWPDASEPPRKLDW
jgi:hypothetical protein